MNAHLEPQPALSRAEREALDEALFCTERSFDLAHLPVYLPPVPEAPAPTLDPVPCVVPDEGSGDFSEVDFTPPPYPVLEDASTDPCGVVSDGGVSYALTNLAPGVYEVRSPFAVPEAAETFTPQPVEPEAVSPAASAPEPVAPEPVCPEPIAPEPRCLRVEVNAGLDVAPGEEACVGPDVLRVAGTEPPSLIELMLLSPPMNGVLLRDGFALTGGDTFTQADVDAGRIRWRHDGAAGEGEDSFSVATPDGELLPTHVEIRVVSPRRAPRLLGAGSLARVTDGVTISDLLGGQIDSLGECGLAVVGIAGGVWTWSRDEGQTWLPIDAIGPEAALLLRPADRLRFAAPPGTATVARLTYRAWDQSSHQAGERADLGFRDAVGGTTAFSREVTTATLRIRPPVALAKPPAAEPWLVPVSGDDLIGGAVAVVRLVGPGIWQYSLGGAAWRECRAVYHGRALLLGADDQLRFVPHEGATGTVSLTLRAWDGEGMPGGHVSLSKRASVGGETPFGASLHTSNWYLDPIPTALPAEEPGVEGER